MINKTTSPDCRLRRHQVTFSLGNVKIKESLIRIGHFLRKYLYLIRLLFLGEDRDPLLPEHVGFLSLCKNMEKAWSSNSFGIFRVFQLSIELAKVAFPSFWITLLFGKKKGNVVDFLNDVWVLVRIALLFILLWWGAAESWQAWLMKYLIADLFIYVSRVVFLSKIYGPILSAERTLLFLLVNYFEIIVGFAFFHRFYGGLNIGPLCPIQALYFSFVTSTTLGDLWGRPSHFYIYKIPTL